jgi:DNA-binding transcriptional LysR family regulator
MELRQLKYFLAVAEYGHFTRAAQALFVSQPALSQQIQALERYVGVTLFDRLGRRVELTAAGKVLRDHARVILREVENARQALNDVRGAIRGEIAIAAIQTANVSFLVDVIASFRRQHPSVVVRVREERSHAIADLLVAGEVQLGLTYLPAGEPDEIEEHELFVEELVLVTPAGDAHAGTTMRTRELQNLPLVVPPGGYCLRGGVDAALAEAGATQHVVAEITTIEGICAAVRAGVGYGILPARYILPRSEREQLGVARLVDPTPRRTVGVVRHKARHLCAASAAFMENMKSAAMVSAPSPSPAHDKSSNGKRGGEAISRRRSIASKS